MKFSLKILILQIHSFLLYFFNNQNLDRFFTELLFFILFSIGYLKRILLLKSVFLMTCY